MYNKIKVKITTEEDYNKLIRFFKNNFEKIEYIGNACPIKLSTIPENPIWFLFTEELYGKSTYTIIREQTLSLFNLEHTSTKLFKSHQEVSLNRFLEIINAPPEIVSDFSIRTNKGEYNKKDRMCFFKLKNEVSGEFVIPEDWSMIRIVRFIDSFDKGFV